MGTLGKESTVVDRDISASMSNKTVGVKDLTYSLPIACTCPVSGSISSGWW